MFSQLEMAPPDPILGLTEAFNQDPNPDKINLSSGVYKASDGTTPILHCVKEAERRILEREASKSYLGMAGHPQFGQVTQPLLLGADHEIVATGRARTAHTPGGTGALRVAADFIQRQLGQPTVWLSDPTWANHPKIFEAAGLKTSAYPYYDAGTHALGFEAMLDVLRQVPAGDVVVLHACCHNPTGVDPDAAQWAALAEVARETGWLPLFDTAYQGFADGLDADLAGLRAFCGHVDELLICSSYSKNFGLYNERTGAFTLVAGDAGAADRAFSHVKLAIRANYSNPPAHGGHIVLTVLEDDNLYQQWEREVGDMRARINTMRARMAQTLHATGVDRDFGFITRQRGMFSFSGLTPAQVQYLRERYAIYIVNSGRINVAGLTEDNLDRFCTAVAAALAAA